MSNDMYKTLIQPLLGRLDSETWHVRAKEALHLAESTPLTLELLELFAAQHKRFSSERLQVNVGGIAFDNPVLVGAGWDKDGRSVRALFTLGFAGVEVGSVLVKAQSGNPKPRQFMLNSGVALNRLGFNSPGMQTVAHNLAKYRGSGIPIGISLGKNKDVLPQDAPVAHALVTECLYDDADYFAINVSSPNTPGLRALQDKGPLTDIVQAVNATMDSMGGRKPLFVKIAPELSNDAVDDVIEVVLAHGLTGIIATNTTISENLKASYGTRWRYEAGGLSGDDAHYRAMSTAKVAHIYRQTQGRITLIGCGGVKDAATALEKIQAGATLVQVVTALRGEGTAVAGNINRGIYDYMKREGIRCVDELVGVGIGR